MPFSVSWGLDCLFGCPKEIGGFDLVGVQSAKGQGRTSGGLGIGSVGKVFLPWAALVPMFWVVLGRLSGHHKI